MQTDQTHLLRANNTLTPNHFLMDCTFTLDISQRCSIDISHNWTAHTFSAVHSLESQINFLYLGVIVNCLWAERNRRIHNPGVSNSAAVIKKSAVLVRVRVLSCPRFQRAAQGEPPLFCLLT